MLKFSEFFEFSKEKFRKIPILKEFEWFEWFEWFGPSPIEPFNSAGGLAAEAAFRRRGCRLSCLLNNLRVDWEDTFIFQAITHLTFSSQNSCVVSTVGCSTTQNGPSEVSYTSATYPRPTTPQFY